MERGSEHLPYVRHFKREPRRELFMECDVGVYARMHVCIYESMSVRLHVFRPVRLHARMYATSV